MGLLTTPTAKKIDEDLVITYTKTRIFGNWVITDPVSPFATWYNEAWQYTRTARKSYRYIGLSLDAAENIAQEIIDNYLREGYQSVWDGGEDFSSVLFSFYCGANVRIVQQVGHIYEVVVEVNETDRKNSVIGSYRPEILFQIENRRSYDY